MPMSKKVKNSVDGSPFKTEVQRASPLEGLLSSSSSNDSSDDFSSEDFSSEDSSELSLLRLLPALDLKAEW